MPTIGIRVSDDEKARLEADAEAADITVSELVRRRIMAFNPEVENYLRRLANALHVDPAMILQNIVIDRIAKADAKTEVWETPPPELLPEFANTEAGLMTGEPLYRMLKQLHKQDMIKQHCDSIVNYMQRPGAVLSPNQRDFLERHGKSYLVPVTEAETEMRRIVEESNQ